MSEIWGIWLCHMSRWDRYVLRPRVRAETSGSEIVPHIGPYSQRGRAGGSRLGAPPERRETAAVARWHAGHRRRGGAAVEAAGGHGEAARQRATAELQRWRSWRFVAHGR